MPPNDYATAFPRGIIMIIISFLNACVTIFKFRYLDEIILINKATHFAAGWVKYFFVTYDPKPSANSIFLSVLVFGGSLLIGHVRVE